MQRFLVLFVAIILLPGLLSACQADLTAITNPPEPLSPVTAEEWRGEMGQRTTEMTREGDHYWRYVPGGTYTIGGWTDDDNDNNDEQAEVELQPYWIGKHPITVAQYRQFIEAGGYDNQDYWTPNGWEWKEAYNEGEGRSQPMGWDKERSGNDNQPVIGVRWYEATAFMNWLNAQLAGSLPEGYAVQLPTEAEWEAACAYDAEGQRHPYPWGEEEPTRDLADFDDGSDPDRAADVGGRTGGAAACGAQDMVGGVWEVATSSYGGYPDASGKVMGDFEEGEQEILDVPWRGYAYYGNKTGVRCAMRLWLHPVYDFGGSNGGLRPVVSPLRAN
jgi:formylglycine-generating enzyme required for sulfatase activity